MKTAKCLNVCFFLLLLDLTRLVISEEHVVTLDINNFDSIVQQGNILVEFYAPWCGHCRRLIPEYEQAAKQLKDERSKIVLAKCDATLDDNKPLNAKYKITGFPTLKLFRQDSLDAPEDYDGSRDAKGIVEAVKKAFGPPSKLFEERKDFAEYGQKEILIVGVFPGESSSSFKTYYKVADKLRSEKIEIAHAFNPDFIPWCHDESQDCKKPFLGVFNSVERNLSVFEDAFEEEKMYSWIQKKITPRLLEVDPERPRMMKKLRDMFKLPEPRLVGYSLDSIAETPAFKSAMIDVDEADDSFHAMYIDAKKNSKAVAFFGLTNNDLPALVLHDHSAAKKYMMKNVAPSDVADWIAKWKAGELKVFYKSEERPKDNAGPVKVIVSKEYKLFLESGKDLFVEFYSQNCGHCKKLALTFEDLGKHFKDNDEVIIAKMDAVNNDVPEERFQVKAYPTLKYIRKNGELLQYTGDLSLADLILFVEKALGIEQVEKTETESAATTDEVNERKEEL